MQERKRNIFTIGIIILAFILVGGFVFNMLLFNRMLDQVAEQYVSENNRQLTEHISYRLKAGSEFVTDFAGTLERMPEFLLTEELLERKCEATGLEHLVVVSKEKLIDSGKLDISFLENWMEENAEVWEKLLISYEENRSIIFTAPVMKNEEVQEVVVGMQSYQGMQTLVNNTDYEGKGLSMLVDMDRDAKVIMVSGNGLSIEEEGVSEFLEKVDGLEKGEVSRQSISGGREVFVTAEQVEGTGWKQIALIPADFFLKQIGVYMKIYVFIVVSAVTLVVVLLIRYMNENKKRERDFYVDRLTGIYNREGFLKQSKTAFEALAHKPYFLVYMNVMDFRSINESWSDEDGNRTLRFIAKMISKGLKEDEASCRSGMDHFFLLLQEPDEETVSRRVENCIREMNECIEKKFQGYELEFTVGACHLERGRKISALMNKTIYASEVGKAKNTCVFYEGKISDQFNREHWMNNVFEEALRNKEFQIYLQPKVDLSSAGCCRAEALVRWKNPREGFIYPSEFIPLFEQNGKIAELDLYMFEEVCKLVDQWRRMGKEIEVSVNLSRFHLRNSGTEICREYRKIKEKYEIPDGLVEIELTETMLLEDNQFSFVKKILDNFRQQGFKVALDDFGFGYSSLAVLKEFDVDVLKLDRVFFINENKKSKKIVSNMISLAHDLGMSVVAEGIEKEEQVEILRNLGCDTVQGYVYSKPLPAEEFEMWREEYAQ